MAKKINFTPDDMINTEETGNKEMLQAMEQAKKEIENEKNGVVKEEKTSKKKTTTKKTNNVPTKKTERKTLSSREILTQKEQAIPDPMNVSAKHEVVTDMKVQINELLPNMNSDLNNIVISDSLNTLEKHTNLDLVFNSKPTFQVALPQSCYTVYMEALKFTDIDAIVNSTMDEYHTTLKMYQIIHNRIQATSIGAISFDTFCECTSFLDLQNLFYGLHMQTFPGETTFDFKCIHCGHAFSQLIPNDNLIFSRDEKIFERLAEVAKNADTPDKVKAGSLIAEHERICLKQSKTIIDIRIPSLRDQLNLLKSVPSDKLTDMAEDLATLFFIKNVLILNVPETLEKKSPVYYPITGINPTIDILKNLSINDAKQLSEAIDSWTNRYKTEYKIPNFKCPSCKEDLGNMPIDMEQILFRVMLNL